MLTFLGPRLSSAAFLLPKPYHRLKSFSTLAVAETLAMAKTLKEADVGISCHVSSLPGFRGVLKQRYADFIVNEVDFDGKIVHLSSFDLPAEFPEAKEEEDPHPNDKSYTNEIELFQSLCGEADAELLRGILERINSNKEEEIPPIILSPDSDKSHRAEVHNFFKKKFKFLVTDTVEGPEGNLKCIRVRYCPGGESSRRGKKRKVMFNSSSRNEMPFDSRGSDNWPDHIGKFLRFHLYKENKDTQEALGVIGKMLGLQQRSFGFAGTKDKRAISTQRVTIFKQYAKRLAALNSRLFGIKVGDFCYVRDGLLLGQLSGNRFTITLRDVVADSEESIKAAADGLGRNGFINYYGLQRFGSGSVPTHLIGASLLRGEWKNAVDLILDPREGERAAIRETREAYKESGDIDLALRQLPRYLVAERSVLKCLKKCPGNYLQALKAIPRILRMMYVHSYQSYLWNHAASIRVQKYGISQVVLGDLVFCKEGSSGKAPAIDNSEPEDDSIDEDNSSNLSDISDAVLLPEEKVQFVKTVNPEDIIAERYTFDDVVLPLPGSRIIYPTNGVTDEYHAIAKKDAINLTESVHGAKEFSITRMTGGYRRVFQRPIDFEWELLTYTDSNIPLAETDLDIMSRTVSADTIKEVGLVNGEPGDQAENFETEKLSSVADCVIEDGNERRSLEVLSACNLDDDQSTKTSHDHSLKTALKLTFTLPASCYATMAIRELLKTSTSVAYHKAISQ